MESTAMVAAGKSEWGKHLAKNTVIICFSTKTQNIKCEKIQSHKNDNQKQFGNTQRTSTPKKPSSLLVCSHYFRQLSFLIQIRIGLEVTM